MFDFFFFSWQVPDFWLFFFLKKKATIPSPQKCSSSPGPPHVHPGMSPCPSGIDVGTAWLLQGAKGWVRAGVCRREGECFLFLEGGSRTWWVERGLPARATAFLSPTPHSLMRSFQIINFISFCLSDGGSQGVSITTPSPSATWEQDTALRRTKLLHAFSQVKKERTKHMLPLTRNLTTSQGDTKTPKGESHGEPVPRLPLPLDLHVYLQHQHLLLCFVSSFSCCQMI